MNALQHGNHGNMSDWLAITLLILNLANVILHGIGIYLLVSLFERSRFRIQQRYLIHLSVCEFTINSLEVIKIINSFVNYEGHTKQVVDGVFQFVLIIQFTGVSLVFYMDMIYITLDRLMEIILNIRYPVYWSEEKARFLLISTWVTAGVVTLAISLAYGLNGFDWEPVIYTYFFPTMEFLFIGLAVTTYTFIFKKYKSTRVSPIPSHLEAIKSSPRTLKRRKSSFYVFRKSKFFIPALLILTFLVFMAGADLTLLFVGVIQENDSQELKTAVFISYAISNLFDAWIYIFLQKDVKRLLFKKLRILSPSQNTIVGDTSFQIAAGKRYSVNFSKTKNNDSEEGAGYSGSNNNNAYEINRAV